MIDKKRSRRGFIRQYIRATLVLLSGGMILSCSTEKKEKTDQSVAFSADPCNDLSGVSVEEIQKRKSLGYVIESPITDNQCSKCNLYSPSNDKGCGACMLFKGPVEAGGYCTYWAPEI